MKAFLLAGGRGERLRPLTLTVPKCLAPVNGRPLLDIWLDLCRRQGIDAVLLNVSHHVDRVRSFLGTVQPPPRVELVVETEPRGSARTVLEHRAFVGDEESFWIFYADNLTDLELGRMAEAHRRSGAVLTMGLFEASDPRSAGIVTLDASGLVTTFCEKPARPQGTLANAGVYLARASIFDDVPTTDGPLDFAYDVLPSLVGRMHGYVIEEFLMDIGTPEALARAEAAWAARAASRS